jgi:hypothetical protein
MCAKRNEIAPDTIKPTTPLRLDIAARLAFPDGSIGASALRTEWKNGNLRIETIANKQFTTLQDIEDMRKKCVSQKGQGSISKESGETKAESSPSAPCGSSVTERIASAQAALKATANKLKKGSANTSPQNTKLPASATSSL